MDKVAAEQLIADLYLNALGRKPNVGEYEKWVNAAVNHLSPERIVRAFYESDEFKRHQGVKSQFPSGHFHSPVVDPRIVKEYVLREQKLAANAIPGIPLAVDSMRELWLKNLAFIKTTPFTDDASPNNRYNYVGGPFPYGDAIILRMMIAHYKPCRIIEIGSGYSTACMLDAAAHASLPPLKLTSIEPYPKRLRSLLRTGDFESVELIERPVQEVPETIVDSLRENDFLFIDSTHVMKTGSDVHFELFHLLPRLKPGVIVHFHDIMFPFEYPDRWVFDLNYSWNEAYAVRAFLMFNREFRVVFWNSLFAREFNAAIRDEYPIFLKNPGGSIWIDRLGTCRGRPGMGGAIGALLRTIRGR